MISIRSTHIRIRFKAKRAEARFHVLFLCKKLFDAGFHLFHVCRRFKPRGDISFPVDHEFREVLFDVRLLSQSGSASLNIFSSSSLYGCSSKPSNPFWLLSQVYSGSSSSPLTSAFFLRERGVEMHRAELMELIIGPGSLCA